MLTGSLGVCRRHALAFLALALVAGTPPVVLFFGVAVALKMGWLRMDGDAGLDLGGMLALALWVPLLVLQVGAATSGTLRALRGEPFELRRALAAGLRRAPAVAAIVVVTGSAVLAGATAFVVPGAAALAYLCVAAPAAVEEGAGPLRALGRSLDLTRGRRPGLFAGIATLAAVAAAAAWVPVLATAEVHPAFALAWPSWVALFAQVPFVGCAVAYAALRDRLEGRSPSLLSRVFE